MQDEMSVMVTQIPHPFIHTKLKGGSDSLFVYSFLSTIHSR